MLHSALHHFTWASAQSECMLLRHAPICEEGNAGSGGAGRSGWVNKGGRNRHLHSKLVLSSLHFDTLI